MKKKVKIISFFAMISVILVGGGCTLFENEHVAKGRKIFRRYCTPCHGKSGEGNGYNAPNLDPFPRDLTDGEEEYMVKLENEEILEVIQVGGYGVDLASTMPAWGKVFSEEELWSLVAYVRTLHPNDEGEIVFENFESERKRYPKVREAEFVSLRDEIITDEDVLEEQVALGEELFEEYGCIGCHAIRGQGGELGPDLTRAGFMLQPQFMYRWILNPQSFKPKTRMPNLGLPKEDALAVALYLSTQKGPPPGSEAVAAEEAEIDLKRDAIDKS